MSYLLWYTVSTIMNDNEQLNALLDAVCEGVELSTEEEEQLALEIQSS